MERTSPLFGRWRELTLALFIAAGVYGLVVTVQSFRGPMTLFLIVFVLGIAASFFGVGLTIFAAVAFMNRANDQMASSAVVGMVMFLIGAPVATGWGGVVACGLLFAARLVAGLGRGSEERYWRRERADRDAFFRRLGKNDPRDDPEAARFLGASPPQEADDVQPRPEPDDDVPVRRKDAVDRARTIDGNPWSLPPE